ncbi:carbohydrate ABC transporter permease [uncultured Hoeflea sp.]|uniref:carbohydrate ABC transporter permease n=1 Tax=uncultured Hoeflea sp. TaxID=538666 RepID=UPI002631080B|nr:carbohydrate ABC transporter permease [uncultured Hoeflea sp.]
MAQAMAHRVQRSRRRAIVNHGGLLLLFWILTAISIYPLIWLVLSSLKTSSEMFGNSWAFPEVWQWDNYVQAWNAGISRYLLSSVIVTLISTLLVVYLSAAAAYALVVLRFRGKAAIYALILGGLILPPEVALFPLFQTLTWLGIYNTYWALIIPYTAFGIPFATFLIRAYMVKIPIELSEAAAMDGAGPLWSFRNIYLPLCRPVLASAALIQSMRSWNEFIFALSFVESENVKTITIGMMSFANALRSDWSVLMAGLVISIIPVLLVFIVLQRQFIGGLTQGAVK